MKRVAQRAGILSQGSEKKLQQKQCQLKKLQKKADFVFKESYSAGRKYIKKTFKMLKSEKSSKN